METLSLLIMIQEHVRHISKLFEEMPSETDRRNWTAVAARSGRMESLATSLAQLSAQMVNEAVDRARNDMHNET